MIHHDDSSALTYSANLSDCTPLQASAVLPIVSCDALCNAPNPGATSGRVSKHHFVFEAGREPLRCSPRIRQASSSRRVSAWQDATGVMPRPTPDSSALVLRLRVPPPPPSLPS